MMSINKKSKIYVIAEIGVNHNGSLSIAKKLIKTAKKYGADAVKLQTYDSNSLVTPYAKKSQYQLKHNNGISQLEMLKKYELSRLNHEKLLKYSDKLKIDFISTPFDIESLKFLISKLRLGTIKVSSTDINNIPFLLEVGSTKANIIISSGMSCLNDVIVALSALTYANKYKKSELKYNFNPIKHKNFYKTNLKFLKSKVSLMHCTTEYPAPINELNLNVLSTYSKLFDIPIGYSDHSGNLITPVIAVTKGVALIEAHITLDKNMIGPDHKASLDPYEFAKYVKNIRDTEIMLGSEIKEVTKSEKKNIVTARKSLILSCDVKKDDKISIDNLVVKRPGNGIQPADFYKTIGKKINKSLRANHVLKKTDIK